MKEIPHLIVMRALRWNFSKTKIFYFPKKDLLYMAVVWIFLNGHNLNFFKIHRKAPYFTLLIFILVMCYKITGNLCAALEFKHIFHITLNFQNKFANFFWNTHFFLQNVFGSSSSLFFLNVLLQSSRVCHWSQILVYKTTFFCPRTNRFR